MTTAKHKLTPTADSTPVIVEISIKKPSGASWVSEFPTSASLDHLCAPFSVQATSFFRALSAAGASVILSATLRPPQRAFLMHWAWKIVNSNIDPRSVPERDGIDIQWAHADNNNAYSSSQSVAAAQSMVNGYGLKNLKVAPSLTSRHIEGNAIDMSISWVGNLSIVSADGSIVDVVTEPRTGMNARLQAVGASYGVIKFMGGAKDVPHWSTDGR